MKVTNVRIHFSTDADSIVVRESNLYYMKPSILVQLNLATRAEEEFKLDCVPPNSALLPKLRNDNLALLSINSKCDVSISELKLDNVNGTVQLTNTMDWLGENLTSYNVNRSSDIDANLENDEFFCYKNLRAYRIQGITPCNPIFSYNDKMCYIVRKESTGEDGERKNFYYLNSFTLVAENQRLEYSLQPSNQVDLCGLGQSVFSYVIDDMVFFVVKSRDVKIVVMDLETKELMDISHRIIALQSVAGFHRICQDGSILYFVQKNTSSSVLKICPNRFGRTKQQSRMDLFQS